MESGNVTLGLQSAEDLKAANVCSWGKSPPPPQPFSNLAGDFSFSPLPSFPLIILNVFNRCFVVYMYSEDF